MLVLPEVLIDQITTYSVSNSNTITVTVNARANQWVVIDQVIWSADVTPQGNTSHITITDLVDNSVVLKWDVSDAGASQITFRDGLVASSEGGGVSVVMIAAQPSLDNHLAVIYR